MIQIIKIQPTKFLINNKVYYFIKPNFLMKDFGKLIEGKLKGSTLGWYIEGGWVSYWTLKKTIIGFVKLIHMQYEIHVTVSTNDIKQFKTDCNEMGVKPIVIEVQYADTHAQQVMTSSKHTGADYQSSLKRLCVKLKERGYDILREKVEIFPEGEKHPDFIYYETHMRLKLRKDSNRELLLHMCDLFDFHLSKNLFKVTPDFDYQMITYRTTYLSLNKFKRLVGWMKGELNAHGIDCDKIEIEECIFDSNVSIDKNWLNN